MGLTWCKDHENLALHSPPPPLILQGYLADTWSHGEKNEKKKKKNYGKKKLIKKKKLPLNTLSTCRNVGI
jgi:hypothetical protein